jgi:hypothetical protein
MFWIDWVNYGETALAASRQLAPPLKVKWRILCDT